MKPSPQSWLWVWFCCISLVCTRIRALELQDLFLFGEEAGDAQLPPGSDSTAELDLSSSLLFFSESFSKVFINTNGFVSLDKPPAEEDYLGKMPASFQMMAVLLGDLDNSDGRGKVFFRQDSSPAVLSRASERIRQAFPRDDEEPSSALIITWENMVAKGTTQRGDRLDTKGNTFQLVVAFMKSSSVAILLYPRDGLHFFSTTIGGDSKVLEAGFNEGFVTSWWWGNKQGTYYQTTTDEESSIRTLTEKTNSGQRGVWVYEIGASPIFLGITSGILSTVPEEFTTQPPITMLPRQPDQPQKVFTTSETLTTEAIPEKDQLLRTIPPSSSQTVTVTPEPETDEPEYEILNEFESEYSESETVTPTYTTTEMVQPRSTGAETRYQPDPRYTDPGQRYRDPISPRFPPVEPDPAGPRYTSPEQVRPVPPHPRPQHPQIVVVDEDEDLDINVFAYNLETCAHNRHKCSQFADCRDYSNGYCCHCRPGFYGNGKDCVAEGKPQRMNGKVSGRVFIGNSPSPVEFSNNDLHSYVVANDGRAYVAISNIPHSLGPSLQPLSSLGGVIGWAFALEQPGFHNGFSVVGGVFSRQADVVFYPGNERLSIRQQFKGIDEHDHLVVSTELEGRLPAIPLGASVQINPYKEVYQYDQNLITSSSNRDYTITSPTGDLQTRSYQWRQTISFQSCAHDDASRAVPPTQQLSVDQIFVMFDTDNRLIRYAMSNKIGSVHTSVPEQNPCFTGRHGCDINAVCRPGEGLQFSCQCTAGFTGDGRYCHDVDECQETPQVCGPNAVCGNQPGTFRCECSAGFVFASDGRTCIEDSRPIDHCQRGTHTCDISERALCRYTGGSSFDCSCLPGFEGDGRTCRDVDECHQDRCHRDATCSNTQGSYTCQCRPGFHGDGFQCSSTEREKTPCERERERVQTASSSSTGFFSFFRPRPAVSQYIPLCDEHGAYEPTQCHTSIGQCWCVDANGQEIPNTRTTGSSASMLCINQAVTPPPIGPTPRPDIRPVAPGTHLLFAQSGRIEHVPLDGYDIKKDEAKPLLHVPDRVIIAVAYDCVDKTVYWSDITGPAISKASLDGGDVVPVITTDLQSPEGIAIDHVARLLFWTDSMRDTVEVSKLDGSQRRVLFDTDLVNPRPIVTNPAYGRLYWADWDRDGPKIEMSNMDGTERVVLVKDDLGLPNGLTFDPDNQQLCWADAGTRKVECMDPHRRIRTQIAEGIQYPFGLVSFGKNLYYTDWRREAVISIDRYTQKETEQFQPQKRSRLYGITTTPTQCPQAYNYCSSNGGCSHLCLPRLGGFTCRCPDATDGRCVDGNL